MKAFNKILLFSALIFALLSCSTRRTISQAHTETVQIEAVERAWATTTAENIERTLVELVEKNENLEIHIVKFDNTVPEQPRIDTEIRISYQAQRTNQVQAHEVQARTEHIEETETQLAITQEYKTETTETTITKPDRRPRLRVLIAMFIFLCGVFWIARKQLKI